MHIIKTNTVKKISAWLFFIILFIVSTHATDYDFYMKRSRSQRIVGWSTLGGGLLLSGIGILVASSSNDNYYDDGNENTAGVLLLLGVVSGIVSIPFMISASVNKHNAKLILDNQKTGFGVPSNVGKNIPGVTMVISFG